MKSKQEGNLYKVVLESEGIDYKNWLHVGDNYISDIKQAKKLGIKTFHYKKSKLIECNKKLIEKNKASIEYQLFIGTSKICNINNQIIQKQNIYRFGTNIGGPILYCYAYWIVQQAINNNFKNLYFIARDGYIVKEIVDIIITKQNLDIKTKYTYGSRKAWRIPNINNFNNYIDILFSEFINKINPEFLSYRLGIELETLCNILNLDKNNRKIKKRNIKKIANLIKSSTEIKEQFLKETNKRKELLKKYFKQELDFEDETFVFVDLQGSGRTQDNVLNILNEIKPCKIITMYYQLATNTREHTDSKRIVYNLNFEPFAHWIELLGRTKEGQTLGYIVNKQDIIPMLEDGHTQYAIKWGVDEYIKGILDFSIQLTDSYATNNIYPKNLLNLHKEYSNYIINDLDKNTAEILGDIPWTTIGTENSNIKVAPNVSFIKAFFCFILGKNLLNSLPFITLSRSSKATKVILNLQEKYKSLLRFLVDIHISKKKKNAYIRLMGIKISFSSLIWQ